MKKLICIALALVLTLALAVTCFAAKDITANGGSKSQVVKVAYTEGSSSDTIYGVDVVFGDMTFAYSDAVQGTWNPETHAYDDAVAAKWTKDSATITVTNHSNTAIVAAVAYNAGTYEGEVDVAIENETLNLGSAVDTAVGEAPSATATVKVSGTATADDAALENIGTVTVTINKAA